MNKTLCVMLLALSTTVAGCVMVPRAQTNYQNLVADLSSRIQCELAVNYRNILRSRAGTDGSYERLKAAYSIQLDTEREWSAGISPFTYMQPITGLLNWSVSPAVRQNAHRLLKVEFIVSPAKLERTYSEQTIENCAGKASRDYYKIYPGNFGTQEWFNQLAPIKDAPSTIGYTVDFTTTVEVAAGVERGTTRFSAAGGGSFKRKHKNTVDFAFTFEPKDAPPAQTDNLLRQILVSLQRERRPE